MVTACLHLHPSPTVSADHVRALLAEHTPPCLSLFMPTHRSVPENRVDRGSFARLMDAFAAQLDVNGSRIERERLLAPLWTLEADRVFWEHTLDGLAVFAADGEAEIFRVSQPMPTLAIVGDRFHTLPLITLAASADRFDLLALTSRTARVYGGTLAELEPVDLGTPEHGSVRLPGEILREDVIDEVTREAHRVRASSGLGRTLHGGFRSKQDDIDADTQRFFREVDGTILERVSQDHRLPLMLVALAEHAAVFRRLSKNPWLEPVGIDRDPARLAPVELRGLAGPIFAEARRRRVQRLLVAYAKAADEGHGSGDPATIARAAVAGQVAILLVEEGRLEPGHLDRQTGEIGWGERAPGVVFDLIGRIAEEVFLRDGEVVTLPRIEMPNENGLAAIWRYGG